MKQEEEVMYYYFNAKGHAMYTPNVELAMMRAKKHGTNSVYVFEK